MQESSITSERIGAQNANTKHQTLQRWLGLQNPTEQSGKLCAELKPPKELMGGKQPIPKKPQLGKRWWMMDGKTIE